MLNKIMFGQYTDKNSLIHKLDPRVKIISLLIISILLFLIKNYSKLMLITIFIISLIILSRIKILNIIRNLRPFVVVFLFIFLMYFLFSKNQIAYGIITIWRFTLLIIMSSILIFTTTVREMTLAIEKFLMPLKIIKINPRDIAVLISITIRFMPLLFLHAEKVRDARLSRLASLKKPKHIKLLMLTLLERIFKAASTLSDAMESRLYSNKNYTNLKELEMSKKDVIVFIILILFSIAVIY